jgi:hypothetical protein
MESENGRTAQQPLDRVSAEVADMQGIRHTAQETAAP